MIIPKKQMQKIAEEVGAMIHRNVNIMDEQGDHHSKYGQKENRNRAMRERRNFCGRIFLNLSWRKKATEFTAESTFL